VSFEELKARSAEVWSSAPWERVAGMLDAMHDHLVRRLGPEPGERWLDVATGTGAVAFRAARAGADVTGVDLAPRLIDTARRLAEEEGLAIRFDVGDAEQLPYGDSSFDVVSSAVGAIFAPDHERAASELARVCRSGGRLGLAAWRPDTAFFPVSRRYRPPLEPGQGDSDDWGREEYASARLVDAFEVEFEEGVNRFEAGGPEEFWALLSSSVGPLKAMLADLGGAEGDSLRTEFVAFLERHHADGRVCVPGDYLLVLGTRR
jgi:SAM-dependent methyltransferase